MRLAVFANQFPSAFSTYFARDMRGLIDAGIEVEVFAIHPLDATLWRCVPGILNNEILPRTKVHHLSLRRCLQLTKFWTPRKIGRLLADVYSVNTSAIRFGLEPCMKSNYAAIKAWAWAQQHPNTYDYVLGYWGNYAGTCAYLYHRLSGVKNPFTLFLHARVDLYKDPIYLRQKLLYADRIITCSDFNREYILRHFSDLRDLLCNKIFVHYHGVDLTELPMRIGDGLPGKVIAVGRFVKHKGFDYLLRAAYLLKCRGIKVEVDLVGDGEESSFLRSLSDELNLGDTVKFRGWLASDQVPAVIRQAMILVHPSPEIGDGVPNVIKEAMAVGTPVIGSNVAGIPELLGNGDRGVLVPPKDVDALAAAIEALLADDNLRKQYAQRARQHAEQRFDLWTNGQQLANLLLSTSRPYSAEGKTLSGG